MLHFTKFGALIFQLALRLSLLALEDLFLEEKNRVYTAAKNGISVRIHQADIQEKMFEVLGFTKEKAQEQFGFLLDAFKYGVPPHAGLAYGMDRMVMLMVGADSIRDVIAFPKVKDASCLMMEAPSQVDPKQLEDLSIGVVESDEAEKTEE